MIKKYSAIYEAVNSESYPVDTNISADLEKIKKHFNDTVIKNYKTKVMRLAYSMELSNPKDGKFIFLSDDFTEQSKNLFNLAFSELKIQIEVKTNKSKPKTEEEPTLNSMEVSSDMSVVTDYDVLYTFYLYWKNIKTLQIDNIKIASYKALDGNVLYISNEDKNAIQKIATSKYKKASESSKKLEKNEL